MRERTELELWSIGYKAIVLLFVVSSLLTPELILNPLLIFYLLLYISANMLFYIIKKKHYRFFVSVLIILITFVVALQEHRLFILLIIFPIFELLSMFSIKQRIVVFPLILSPLIFMPPSQIQLYMLVAILTLIYVTMFNRLNNKLQEKSFNLDQMRNNLDRLQNKMSENKEFIRQTEYTYKLEERNRMSQDIHDNIGHALTGALIQMEAAKRLIQIDPEKSLLLLDNAIHISKDGIDSIRSELKRIKPALEQLGINRMKLLINEFSTIHSIRTILTHEGDIDIITPIQWKIIIENCKEALTNVLKYSEATSISIRIQVYNTLIKCEVADNGKGATKIIKGLGIIGMDERTASVNGKVIVDGSKGFSVTTLLPYGDKE